MEQRNQDWLSELDLLRGVAILAVVLIHITSLPAQKIPVDSHLFWPYNVFNSLLAFAVPTFLLISVLALSYSREKSAQGWGGFYRRRLGLVLPPYYFWTALYLAYRFLRLGEDPGLLADPGQWRLWLLLGKGYTHLYYLALTLQLYAVFPLLHYLIRQARTSFGYVMIMAALVQVAAYWLNRLYIYNHIPYPASLIIWYLPVIMLGTWLGSNYRRLSARWWRLGGITSIGVVVPAVYLYLQQAVTQIQGRPLDTFVYEMSWDLYVTATALVLLFLSRRSNEVGEVEVNGQEARIHDSLNKVGTRGKTPKWTRFWGLSKINQAGRRLLASLGSNSFGIYLIHPLILSEWRFWVQSDNFLYYHLSIWLGFIFVLGLSWLITSFSRRRPWGFLLAVETNK